MHVLTSFNRRVCATLHLNMILKFRVHQFRILFVRSTEISAARPQSSSDHMHRPSLVSRDPHTYGPSKSMSHFSGACLTTFIFVWQRSKIWCVIQRYQTSFCIKTLAVFLAGVTEWKYVIRYSVFVVRTSWLPFKMQKFTPSHTELMRFADCNGNSQDDGCYWHYELTDRMNWLNMWTGRPTEQLDKWFNTISNTHPSATHCQPSIQTCYARSNILPHIYASNTM